MRQLLAGTRGGALGLLFLYLAALQSTAHREGGPHQRAPPAGSPSAAALTADVGREHRDHLLADVQAPDQQRPPRLLPLPARGAPGPGSSAGPVPPPPAARAVPEPRLAGLGGNTLCWRDQGRQAGSPLAACQTVPTSYRSARRRPAAPELLGPQRLPPRPAACTAPLPGLPLRLQPPATGKPGPEPGRRAVVAPRARGQGRSYLTGGQRQVVERVSEPAWKFS